MKEGITTRRWRTYVSDTQPCVYSTFYWLQFHFGLRSKLLQHDGHNKM